MRHKYVSFWYKIQLLFYAMILELLLKNVLLQYSFVNMVTDAYVYTLGFLFMIMLTFAEIKSNG